MSGSEFAIVHLVDDDGSFLTAMSRLLSLEGFKVSTFDSGVQLLEGISSDSRGCVVADLEMPGINGLELQSQLEKVGIAMPVIFLTGYGDVPNAVRAMRGGALDFLEKRTPKEALLDAIRVALERDAAGHSARLCLRDLDRRFARLTIREREVLHYVVGGRMNKEIAAELGINERTVKLHRTAITTKIGVRSVAQLATLTRDARVFEREDSARSE